MGPKISKLQEKLRIPEKEEKEEIVNKSVEETKDNYNSKNTHQLLLLFYRGFRFDNQCNLQIFPTEIIQLIMLNFPLSFAYNFPFDQNGVLSFIRNSLFFFSTNERENIINFYLDDEFSKIGRGVYLIPNDSGELNNNLTQSQSIEILGQETNLGSFCSSTIFGTNAIQNHFIIDLKYFNLQLSHLTMSCSFYPDTSYLKSTRVIGPTFSGSHVHPSKNEWEIIENEWEPIDLEFIPRKASDDRAYTHGRGTWKFKTHVYYRYFQIQQGCNVSKRFGSEQANTGDSMQSILSGLEMYGNVIVNSNL